jgi:rod shape-determining protein MreB
MSRKRIKHLIVNDLAMDLGTVNTRIYASGAGIVLNEPSTIATDKQTGAVVAIGRAAEAMFEQEPYGVAVHHPVRAGTIVDFVWAGKMIKGFLRQAGARWGKYTRVLFGIPVSTADIQRRALSEAARRAGVHRVELLDAGLAAALGSGRMSEDHTKMVIDIGGGTTNYSVVSSDGVLLSWRLKIAGTALTQAIMDDIRHRNHILIGYRTAEEIKLQLGSVSEPRENTTLRVIGKSSRDGAPQAIAVGAVEVAQALEKAIRPIVNGVHFGLQQAPPGVVRTIYRSSLVLTGGGSLLGNLESRLSDELGINVQRAESPLEAVALGAGQWLEDPQRLKKFYVSAGRLAWPAATEAYGLAPY